MVAFIVIIDLGDNMDKYKKLELPFLFLITIIIALVLMSHKKTYPTLKEAVRVTSNGGEVEDKIKAGDGTYVFIKNSTVITSGYYYKENGKWKYNPNIKKTNYELSKTLHLSVYSVLSEDISILELISDEKIESIDKVFTQKKKKENEFITIVSGQINKDYKIMINNQEYSLK